MIEYHHTMNTLEMRKAEFLEATHRNARIAGVYRVAAAELRPELFFEIEHAKRMASLLDKASAVNRHLANEVQHALGLYLVREAEELAREESKIASETSSEANKEEVPDVAT